MTALLAKTPGALNPLPPVVLPRIQVVSGRDCNACEHERKDHDGYGCLKCSGRLPCAMPIFLLTRRAR